MGGAEVGQGGGVEEKGKGRRGRVEKKEVGV